MRVNATAVSLGVIATLAVVGGLASGAAPPTDATRSNPAQPVAASYQPIDFGQPCPADQAVGISETGRVFHCGAWSDGRTLRWDD